MKQHLVAHDVRFPKGVLVAIDSDTRIKKLKGSNRPINSQLDRIQMLVAIKYVDKVIVFSNDDELDYLAKRHPEAILQELLEPDDREVTCAVYRRRDGEVTSLLMLRRLSGGFTGWAKVIKDDETSRMCDVIAQGLDLRGSMNIQLRLTAQGPRVFEINPRFSSTVLMRHRLGFSDVLWAVDEAEGKSISFPAIRQNSLMARVQGATVFEDIEVGAGE